MLSSPVLSSHNRKTVSIASDPHNNLGKVNDLVDNADTLLSTNNAKQIETLVKNGNTLLSTDNTNNIGKLLNSVTSILPELRGFLTKETFNELSTLLTNGNSLLNKDFVTEHKDLSRASRIF